MMRDPMAENPKYDLLLRGGVWICPASGIDGVRDLAIRDGRIAAVEETILPSSARETIDVSGKLVLPGMIDTHAHVYQYVTGRFGVNPDMVGVRSGVTTVIDQGGPSCMTLPGFRHFVVEKAETQVYAFLSVYLVGGLEGHTSPSTSTRWLPPPMPTKTSCAASRVTPRSAASRVGASKCWKCRLRPAPPPVFR